VEQTHYFGGGGDTNIHPIVLVILLFATALIFFLRRKYVVYPFLLAAVLIPISQVVVIGGLHFMGLRILIFVGWVRILCSRFITHKEPPLGSLNGIDKAFVAWIASLTIIYTILWGQLGAFLNQLGLAYTDLGLYFLFRFLIRDDEDSERAIRALAIVCFICGVLMVNEQLTGKNLFGYLGSDPSLQVTLREGKLRSQASFLHPLLAGAFGATITPAFVGLWWKNRSARFTATVGIIGGLLMAIASMSSTSIIGIAAGALALAFWPLRHSMRVVRWAIAVILVALHLVMKAPVWALIARIDLTGGSSGYHRFELVNQTILRFPEWWLVGTTNQANWGWDMWDSINWYVSQCTSGGLITLILFLAVLIATYKRIGIARGAAEAKADEKSELFIWALGATLFANTLSFIGISYFDQSIVVWLTFLTIVSAATENWKALSPAEAPTKLFTRLALKPHAQKMNAPSGLLTRQKKRNPEGRTW
jgi:hypothetical protein